MRSLIPLTLLIFLLSSLLAQEDPCASAPTATAKILCRQIHKWDDGAREASKKKKIALPPGLAKGMAAEFAPIASNIYQCMDLPCLCSYLRGTATGNGGCTLPNGQPLQKSVRKEYRMLTDDERNRLHAAFRALKNNGEYDRIGRIHSQMSAAGGAHSGPAFLPWHREFVKRVEFALRQVDPSVSLPYWDSTLDSGLPRPADTIMFSEYLVGGTGLVSNGPFTNWRTLAGRAQIQRAVGAQGAPLSQADIDFVMRQTQIDQVLSFTAPQQGCPYRTDFNCLEYTHGNVHIFVGGDMFDTATSSNDPSFFLHHSFIDFVWEMWRLARQSRADREIAFPPDNQLCASPQHFGASPMQPFSPMRNIDGLSNKFTDNLYSYAPRPTCQAGGDCGSKFLFCDTSTGVARCVSRIRPGSQCGQFRVNPCFSGVCQNGVCVLSATAPRPTPAPVTPPPANPNPVQSQESCFNENQCCASWAASGECSRNTAYMNEWCKASCGVCKPKYRLADDCTDRHTQCASWSRSGECTKNALWMTENCRKSCNKCGRSRAQECGGGGNTVTTTTPSPAQQCDNSDGCYNENVCCAVWGLMGECRKNTGYMACNCRVSCGHCFPEDYNYGSCVDYHRSCAGWARVGECQKNPWMAENCRSSCNSCYTQSELRRMCGTTAGSVAPVAQVRQNNPSRQPPRGGWGRNDDFGGGGWGGNGGGWGGGDPWGGSRWGSGGGGWGGGGGGWGGGGWGKRSIRAANASIAMPAFDPDLL
ncbi:hypothetical protein L5515_000726 [Caenorhabditis briggsae]|uniref:ShKT domain-containing protein n=2 Tax=Caenorhabditis briggsae TaxID=6238 RepID=A0AAE9E3C5_CAEBR|nr:hypothetical protein L5515_000726 [Caenorhabditis briggsae]